MVEALGDAREVAAVELLRASDRARVRDGIVPPARHRPVRERASSAAAGAREAVGEHLVHHRPRIHSRRAGRGEAGSRRRRARLGVQRPARSDQCGRGSLEQEAVAGHRVASTTISACHQSQPSAVPSRRIVARLGVADWSGAHTRAAPPLDGRHPHPHADASPSPGPGSDVERRAVVVRQRAGVAWQRSCLALHGARGEPADDVLLQEEEQHDHRDAPPARRRPRTRPSPRTLVATRASTGPTASVCCPGR